MLGYQHQAISINGRDVALEEIVDNRAVSLDEFEKSTFDFIKDWYIGKETFDIETSGSTGIPKTISITRGQFIASAKATAAALNLKSDFTALVCLDTRYIGGRMMLVRCFVTGMKILAITPSSNPLKHFNTDIRISFAALVPLQAFEILKSSCSHFLNKIDIVIIGGSSISWELEEKLKYLNNHIYATYGMTETISHIALRRLNNTNSRHFEILPNITIDIDKRSCLIIRAPYLRETVITNDIVKLIDATHFVWLGRWDNIINSGGLKIQPEKVEEQLAKVLKELGITANFFISSAADAKLGSKLVLFIEDKLPTGLSKSLLISKMKEKVEKYHVPSQIIYISTFLYTKTGKIDRIATKNKQNA